jgi:AraC-like DNA-binding protein
MEGHFRIHDPDTLVRIAERDPLDAMGHLALNLEPPGDSLDHWTDQLASALAQNPAMGLQEWAERRGIRPDVVSHAFRRDFGVSPKLYRLECRARRAWRQVIHSNETLTRIALDADFSDLAHMSNSIKEFTGLSPTQWRARSRVPVPESAVSRMRKT